MKHGRFAPSPTGPMHMGSLVTAVASYLDITHIGGEWHIRMDDLDKPREVPGARAAILASLSRHALHSASPVHYQSQHNARYQRAFTELEQEIFYCNCTRAALKTTPVYPGRCRGYTLPRDDCAARLRAHAVEIKVNDAILAPRQVQVEAEVGDVIVKRRDGPWAYNFATAIDDGQDFQRVLRGQDLAGVTPVQIAIMQRLQLPAPDYVHIPLLCYADGVKLSKQTGAPALRDDLAAANLRQALILLGQSPPAQPTWSAPQWLTWGRANWNLAHIPAQLVPFA